MFGIPCCHSNITCRTNAVLPIVLVTTTLATSLFLILAGHNIFSANNMYGYIVGYSAIGLTVLALILSSCCRPKNTMEQLAGRSSLAARAIASQGADALNGLVSIAATGLQEGMQQVMQQHNGQPRDDHQQQHHHFQGVTMEPFSATSTVWPTGLRPTSQVGYGQRGSSAPNTGLRSVQQQ